MRYIEVILQCRYDIARRSNLLIDARVNGMGKQVQDGALKAWKKAGYKDDCFYKEATR